MALAASRATLGCLLVFLCVAVGVHFALIAAFRVLPAQRNQLFVGVDGGFGVVLLALHIRQAVQEDGAVVLLAVVVVVVGLCGACDQAVQYLRGLGIAAERVVGQRLVEEDLVGIGGKRLRLFECGQGLLVVALAALAFGDARQRLRILWVGRGDLLVGVLRILKLIVVQQRLGECALGIQVVGIQIDGLLVGGDGILRVLDLVVSGAQCEGELGGAVIFRNGLQRRDGALEVAAFAIEPGEIEGDVFGVGIDLPRCLELLLRQLRVVVDGVELPEHEVALDVGRVKRADLLVFADREIEHLLRSAVLHVAQRVQVDAAEQLMSGDILGVALDGVLRGQDRVAHAAGAEVELGQAVVQKGGGGVGVQRQLVLFDGAGGVVLAAGVHGHVFVGVGQREMVVGSAAGCFLGRNRGGLRLGGRRGLVVRKRKRRSE